MPALLALLHDPVTGKSHRVEVEVAPGPLGGVRFVDATGVPRAVAASEIRLLGGGFAGEAISLAWEEGALSFALSFTAPDAVAALRDRLPVTLAAELARFDAREAGRRRRGRMLLAVGLLAFLVPLLVVAALVIFRERILDAVIRRIPLSVDARLGEMVRAEVARGGGLVADGPALAAVRAAGERLADDPGFSFDLVRDETVNAFAAPGGYIVVHTGLLAEAGSVDELYGVLAHEIIHVRERHALRQMVFRLGAAGGLGLVFGPAEGTAGKLAAVALDLGSLRFGREQESAADRGAVALLAERGLPAAGLLGFFTRMASREGAPPAFLSSHPAPAERLRAIEAAIAGRSPAPAEGLPIDWEAVRSDARQQSGEADR